MQILYPLKAIEGSRDRVKIMLWMAWGAAALFSAPQVRNSLKRAISYCGWFRFCHPIPVRDTIFLHWMNFFTFVL